MWVETLVDGRNVLAECDSMRIVQYIVRFLFWYRILELCTALGNAAQKKIKKDGHGNNLIAQAEKDYQAFINNN